MEDKISSPNIVKGIPAPLIRPLPPLYYYGRFSDNKHIEHAQKFFSGNVSYLIEGINILTKITADKQFDEVSQLTSTLLTAANNKISDIVYAITSDLSALCTKYSNVLKNNPDISKENLATLYQSKVTPLQVLLIDNNNESERMEKLLDIFQNTCYYRVTQIKPHSDRFVEKINSNDFIIFASAYPIHINEQVQNIQQYRKPCMVMAELKKDKKIDQQTLRNGAWLQSRGFEVLYKIFTPLRLFTTIDKLYLKFILA